MPFLPKDYKAPVGSGSFMRFQDGDNRFRIMTPAVIGWEGWKDNKPFRRKGIEKNIEDEEVDTDSKYGKPKPKINHFWAFLIYDYADKKIKILEITQKTIMKVIQTLVEDGEWGDPAAYDISVTKTKKGQRTNYAVKAYPPKPVTKEVKALLADNELDVEDLFKDASEESDGFDEM